MVKNKENLRKFILEILFIEPQPFKLLMSILNDPYESIYLEKNNGKKFEDEDIKTELKELFDSKMVFAKEYDNLGNEFIAPNPTFDARDVQKTWFYSSREFEMTKTNIQLTKIDQSILEILLLDDETFALIKSLLNDSTDETFINGNQEKKFTDDEITKSLKQLFQKRLIKVVSVDEYNNPHPNPNPTFVLNETQTWYSITRLGKQVINQQLFELKDT